MIAENVKKSINDKDIREKLSEDAYHVTREGGTEKPFTGAYWNNHEKGMYACVVCGQKLFSSDTKFDSGTGWPSFSDTVNLRHIDVREDRSQGMLRTEVRCKACGSHLGHIFEDGPKENGGKRFCINSCALDFQKI